MTVVQAIKKTSFVALLILTGAIIGSQIKPMLSSSDSGCVHSIKAKGTCADSNTYFHHNTILLEPGDSTSRACCDINSKEACEHGEETRTPSDVSETEE